eukprot:SAG11_NODE_630_length_8069_cov_2.158344_4_plen_288_part_00
MEAKAKAEKEAQARASQPAAAREISNGSTLPLDSMHLCSTSSAAARSLLFGQQRQEDGTEDGSNVRSGTAGATVSALNASRPLTPRKAPASASAVVRPSRTPSRAESKNGGAFMGMGVGIDLAGDGWHDGIDYDTTGDGKVNTLSDKNFDGRIDANGVPLPGCFGVSLPEGTGLSVDRATNSKSNVWSGPTFDAALSEAEALRGEQEWAAAAARYSDALTIGEMACGEVVAQRAMDFWRCRMHRGACFDRLGRLDEALVDFDLAAKLVSDTGFASAGLEDRCHLHTS